MPTAEYLRSPGITPVHRYYVLIRHPLVFDPLPGATGYKVYLAPDISIRDEEGFSSCLVCSCQRAVAITPPEGSIRNGQSRINPTAFTPALRVRPPGLRTFEATYAFTFVTAR